MSGRTPSARRVRTVQVAVDARGCPTAEGLAELRGAVCGVWKAKRTPATLLLPGVDAQFVQDLVAYAELRPGMDDCKIKIGTRPTDRLTVVLLDGRGDVAAEWIDRSVPAPTEDTRTDEQRRHDERVRRQRGRSRPATEAHQSETGQKWRRSHKWGR